MPSFILKGENTLKLLSLFEAQERLDNKIIEIHGLKGQNLTGNITMSLFVEVGELANTIEFFKHWKKNKRNDKERQWDEWADCLHFLLSLGNKYGHSDEIDEIKGYTASQMLKPRDYHCKFQDIYQTDFSKFKEYVYAMKTLLTIGYLIGMTEKDMEAAYFAKNKVNYERLERGY